MSWDAVLALLGTGPWIVAGLVVVGLLERRWPARRHAAYWPRQFLRDAGAFAIVALASKVIDPTFAWVGAELAFLRPAELGRALPWPVKVVVCLVLGDLLQYGVHRAMHANRVLWRTHRWHHEPTMLTALAGYRGSVTHRLLFGAAALLLPAILVDLHEPVAIAVLVGINLAHDLYIHANLTVRLGPLEHVLATPQWHRVHHGRDPALCGSNFGGRLVIWDRLFGTYRAPGSVPEGYELGIEERGSRISVILGL